MNSANPTVSSLDPIGVSKTSLDEKFALIHEHWRPKVVGQLNGQELKLVKFAGVFPWHQHESEDELFLVWRGQMTVEFKGQSVALKAGEFCIDHGVRSIGQSLKQRPKS